MIELLKIIVVVSCVYLTILAFQFPQIAAHTGGKHGAIKTVAISGLTALCLLGVCIILFLILV
jgi:hypothetical protein